jgi:primosomal protein N' (replication factor Y) (superfamily II helicase)
VQCYGFQTCVEAELQKRAELNYPPFGQLVLVRLSSPEESIVEQAAELVADVVRQAITTQQFPAEVLGPAPASILRVAGRFRWQLMIKLPANLAGDPHLWQLPLAEMRQCCNPQVRLTIDVDPMNLL